MLSLHNSRGASFDVDHSVSNLILVAGILLPAISATATYIYSRELLLLTYMLVGLMPLLAMLRPKSTNETPLIVLLWGIGLSLLLSNTLLSNAIVGQDIQEEFYVYLQVLKLGFWNPASTVYPQISSVLSISILPTVITLVSALDGVKVFEIVFPFVFSLVPVALYKVFRRFVGIDWAFLSVFLFVSWPAFSRELIGLGRQEIGELLLVLLLLGLLSSKMDRSMSGKLVLVLLLVGFVTAHYSLAFIVLPILILSYATVNFLRRRATTTLTLVLLLIVATFGWYAYVGGGSALTSLATAISGVTTIFTSSPSKNPNGLQAVVFQSIPPGPLPQVSRLVQLLVQFCLGLGVLAIVLKRRKSPTEIKMLPIMVGSFIFLAATVIFPYLASAFQLTRVYHIALLLMAPCFIYGIEFIDSAFGKVSILFQGHSRSERLFTSRSVKSVFAAAVLISYFFFVSGWVAAAAMEKQPDSLTLDMQRIRNSSDVQVQFRYYGQLVVATDIAGVHWLNIYNRTTGPICSDLLSRLHVLTSYGGYPPTSYGSYAAYYDQFLPDCASKSSYIYLGEFNTVSGVGYNAGSFQFYTSSLNLGSQDLVYSNGGTTIYD